MNERDFWTSEDCATYFGCSREHFMKRYSVNPTFPEPGSFPVLITERGKSRLTRSRPMWRQADVKKWAAENWTTEELRQEEVTP